MAVGAYTSAILSGKVGLPFPVAFICSGLMAGGIGLIFGIPSVRIKGFYLAITSIAAQFIILWVINHWTGLTGGFSGITAPYASIGGLIFDTEGKQFYLIMVCCWRLCLFCEKHSPDQIGKSFYRY